MSKVIDNNDDDGADDLSMMHTSSCWNISLLSVTNIIILPSVHFAS